MTYLLVLLNAPPQTHSVLFVIADVVVVVVVVAAVSRRCAFFPQTYMSFFLFQLFACYFCIAVAGFSYVVCVRVCFQALGAYIVQTL